MYPHVIQYETLKLERARAEQLRRERATWRVERPRPDRRGLTGSIRAAVARV